MPGAKDDIVAALVAKRKMPEMRAYTPSWRERIGNAIYDGAKSVGLPANRMREEGQVAADFVPGVGDAIAANDAARDFGAGNYGMAAGGAALAAFGLVPGVGEATAGLGKAVRKRVAEARKGKAETIDLGTIDADTPDATLQGVLSARAAEMEKPKAQRTQPSGDAYFDGSPEAYRDPRYMPAQSPTNVPRKPGGIK